MEITIDPEFHALIPPLQSDEYQGLEQSLIKEGCRDALVLWNDILLDGHNRYEICNRLNIQFNTIIIELPDRDAAMDWIDATALGRRNLTPDQMSLIRGRRYNRQKKVAYGRSDRDFSGGQNDHPKTAEVIAKESGVSERTVRRDAKIVANLAPEEEKAVLHREKKLSDVRREHKRKEHKKKIDDIIKQRKSLPLQVKLKLKPSLILADPPWKYDFAETESREIENQYATLTVQDIVTHIPVTEKDCVLFLWATAPKLREALEVTKKWGFEYKTHAVWNKEIIGSGYWFRGQHELLMVATKGTISPPLPELRVSSVFTELRTTHSTKPECVYEWIEKAFPHLVKHEMFCRKPRPGWSCSGDEIV